MVSFHEVDREIVEKSRRTTDNRTDVVDTPERQNDRATKRPSNRTTERLNDRTTEPQND